MELNILIGAGIGAAAGTALASIYARWPSVETSPQGAIICSTCKGVIRQRWSLPFLWLLRQRGRCAGCGARIDPLLPAIELLAPAIGVGAAVWSADPMTALTAALLGWQLLLLAVLDLTHRWLPDPLNLLLAATGLGFAAVMRPEVLPNLLLGLIAGYASLELVRRGYRQLRGRDGLGGGDPKLFAAIGCWLGWHWLPWVMVLAALGGLFVAAVLALAGRSRFVGSHLPLGTMLALAAWPIWLMTGAS